MSDILELSTDGLSDVIELAGLRSNGLGRGGRESLLRGSSSDRGSFLSRHGQIADGLMKRCEGN